MSVTHCPTLPNELWIRIVNSLTPDEDAPLLWKTCRHVNTVFRDAAESAFIDRYLRQTSIFFHLTELYYDVGEDEDEDEDEDENEDENEDDRHPSLDANFEFAYLSDDKSTATFTLDLEDVSERWQRKLRGALEIILEDPVIDEPRHMVHVRRDVNDGPIAGLIMNYEKLELTCNWRDLYVTFYNEEFLYHKYLSDAVDGMKSSIDAMKQGELGRMDPMAVVQKAMEAFAAADKQARKKARRARIQWQYKKKYDGEEYDLDLHDHPDTERKCLSEIHNARYSEGFAEYSDDEEDEEEDDEAGSAGDESEGDDWEDADSGEEDDVREDHSA